MNDYEIMLLLDPELAEEQGNAIIQRMRDSVDGAQGSWDGHEPWGGRRGLGALLGGPLAMEHVFCLSIEKLTGTTVPRRASLIRVLYSEITRVLKITDGVMRHGAYRRVKGSQHQKAPSQAPLAPVAAEQPMAAAAVEADDTDEASE